jgi:hypothetical protein
MKTKGTVTIDLEEYQRMVEFEKNMRAKKTEVAYSDNCNGVSIKYLSHNESLTHLQQVYDTEKDGILTGIKELRDDRDQIKSERDYYLRRMRDAEIKLDVVKKKSIIQFLKWKWQK